MAAEYNPQELQKKWIKRWQEGQSFLAKPDKARQKFYLTVAFPYPSGAIHVGHGRTYTVPDVIARFKRMQGFNVLFPMAWHVTGSPVLGVAERIKNRDPQTLKIYGDLYKVPEEILKTFIDPKNIVTYFSKSYRENMTRMGYSIDWSRQFFSITPQYSKFIEWQYRKLHEAGLVKKGKHPVRYCPRCDHPVGDHDLLEGEKSDINEFTVIKFYVGDLVLPAATLRPETIFGVTNMWLNPLVVYKKVRVGKETWLLSQEALEKLKFCKDNLEVVGELSGQELIGQTCRDSFTAREIPILEAAFVDPNYATGVVMSVPAHAPYDMIALTDLGSQIKAITIIDGAKGENPAQKLIDELNITSQKDEKKLAEATEILYREEHAKGTMSKGIPKYGGLPVKESREKIIEELLEQQKGDVFYEFSEQPVICRCGSPCVIKILQDQWFVAYGDPDWKEKAHQCFDGMAIIPPEIKENFYYFIDWLKDWACTRRIGLGTHLPWDNKWLIEPLSDSTIYMAYYTIAPHLSKLDAGKLTDEFFDYILLGKGDAAKVAKNVKTTKEKVEAIRNEFSYWYPPQWRLSAKDLVGNHLTFHVFHHTAIFPPEKWPQGIVVFGMGLMEGQKMSSSKGNVVLLEDVLNDYGSDTVRLFLMSNAEPWQDFNWQSSLVKGTEKKIKQFYDQVNHLISLGKSNNGPEKDIDRWLLSRVHEAIDRATQALETFQIRKAIQHSFFILLNDVAWYLKRAEPNPLVLDTVAGIWIRLMAPFTPFVCEELWEKYAPGQGLVSVADYPVADKEKIDSEVVVKEDLIKNTIEDIRNILEVTKVTPQVIYLYLAPSWARDVLMAIKENKPLSEIMKDESMRKHGQEIAKLFKSIRPTEIADTIVTLDQECLALDGAKNFLEREFTCQINIQKEVTHDPADRAKYARPMRPGIYVEK